MIEVKLWKKKSSEVLEIVQSMRDQGMVQGVDFDFNHTPTRTAQDNNLRYIMTLRHTVFSFYTEKYASMFMLKYGQYTRELSY